MLELAERAEPHLYGHQQRRWLEQLDAEAANLRAVLSETAVRGATPSAGRLARRLADALAWYWYLRGRHREARRFLGMVLRLPGAAPSGTAVREAAFAMLTGDGTGPSARGGTLLRELAGKDPRAGWFLALTHLHFGDIETGADLTDLTLAAFRASGDSWGEAAALSGRARQAMFRGDLATAKDSGTRSLELFTALGDQWGQLQATDMLGWLAEVTGDYVRAARLHREGLRTAESLRLRTDVSYRLSSLGRIALLTGDFARAVEFHERGMRLAAEQSNPFAEEFARVGLGLVARRTGDLAAAEAHFGASLAWHRRLEADYGLPFYGVLLSLAELGFAAEQRGDGERAHDLHAQGLVIARKIGDPRAVALAKEGLAGVAALAGRAGEAARLLGEAAGLRQSVGAPLPPAERGDVDRMSAAARAALGEAAFTTAFRRGREDLGGGETHL